MTEEAVDSANFDDRYARFNKQRAAMNEQLPEEDRCAVRGELVCGARNGAGFSCTRRKDHAGGHVAHVAQLKKVVARWQDAEEVVGGKDDVRI